MTHLLAIDPGSNTSGWLLARRENARVRYLTAGTCNSDPKGIRGVLELVSKLITNADYDTVVIALEVVEGAIFAAFRGPHLLATAEMVGVIVAVAWEEGIPIRRFTASSVRKTLVGKANSPKKGVMDRLIGDAVRANVLQWPGESNVHTRDAAALAIVANWQLVSRRVA